MKVRLDFWVAGLEFRPCLYELGQLLPHNLIFGEIVVIPVLRKIFEIVSETEVRKKLIARTPRDIKKSFVFPMEFAARKPLGDIGWDGL